MSLSISRRDFLKASAAFASAGGLDQSLADDFHSPAEELAEFDYGAVRLTGGPLKQQYDRIRDSYLALDNDRLLKPYRERAGLPAPGAEMGGWYGPDGFVPGHSLGQYISGMARFGGATGDASCNAKVGELVSGFAATLVGKDRIYAGVNAEKVWPCYVLDKHLAGLIDAFTLTGIAVARELLPRVLRGAIPYIPERGRDRVGKKDPPYDETYVLPENLFSAYALTGDRAFRDRAVAYLLDREYFDPLARGEDVLPGRHAYSHAIALSSAAKARLVLGEERYLRSMATAWRLLASEQQYASGGWGPNEVFVEPHRGELYASLQSTEDHFETPCGSYAAIKLARYLLRATGDGRYGDGLERVLYNGLLGVKEPDGEGDSPYYSTYSPNAQKVYLPAEVALLQRHAGAGRGRLCQEHLLPKPRRNCGESLFAFARRLAPERRLGHADAGNRLPDRGYDPAPRRQSGAGGIYFEPAHSWMAWANAAGPGERQEGDFRQPSRICSGAPDLARLRSDYAGFAAEVPHGADRRSSSSRVGADARTFAVRAAEPGSRRTEAAAPGIASRRR